MWSVVYETGLSKYYVYKIIKNQPIIYPDFKIYSLLWF